MSTFCTCPRPQIARVGRLPRSLFGPWLSFVREYSRLDIAANLYYQFEDVVDHYLAVDGDDGDALIASLQVNRSGGQLWLHRALVHPHYRRLGIMRRLVDMALNDWRDQGVLYVDATTKEMRTLLRLHPEFQEQLPRDLVRRDPQSGEEIP